METKELAQAAALFETGYRLQMSGRWDMAVDAYKKSLSVHPTAEAHTFLGWTYSFMRRFDDAIAECKKAIDLDPEFGNPYNDIGAYLIEMGRLNEALPWLEQAAAATRYQSHHYPWFNMARIYAIKRDWSLVRLCAKRALYYEPTYTVAKDLMTQAEGELKEG